MPVDLVSTSLWRVQCRFAVPFFPLLLFDVMRKGEHVPCRDRVRCFVSLKKYQTQWQLDLPQSHNRLLELSWAIPFLGWWALCYIPTSKYKILLLKMESGIAHATHNRNFRICIYITRKNKNKSYVYQLGFSIISVYV